MAFDPTFKMSIQAASGGYYAAFLRDDATWSVTVIPPATTPSYLQYLPDGWQDTAITWERDESYLGVFRSMTSSTYRFSKDGRAILAAIRNAGGIQGFGTLTIYMFNQATFNYDVFYQSQLDFSTYKDIHWQQITEIGTLDSGLVRDLHAYGDTVFNIPIWQPAVSSPGGPSWAPYNNNLWVLDDGCKLLYQANFISAASASLGVDLNYSPFGTGLGSICGFNHGGGAHSHTIPSLSPYNIVQNNGATTFIGNDILQPFLLQTNQNPGAAATVNESNFNGINNSQPYTRSNYSLKNAIPYPQGQSFMVNARITGAFSDWGGNAGAITGINPDPFYPGTGYHVGDLISVAGTTGTSCQLQITAVLPGGAVAPGGIATGPVPGSGYSTGVNIATTNITGTGTGLRVDITGVAPGTASVYLTNNPSAFNSSYLAFAIFEIQASDLPTGAASGNYYTYFFNPSTGLPNPNTVFWKYRIPTHTSGWCSIADADFDSGNIPLQINPNCVYVFCLLFDDDAGSGFGGTENIYCSFSALQFSLTSLYDYGASGVPIPAPQLNPSVYAGYRLWQLMEMLTGYLSTRNTDINGFPLIPAGSTGPGFRGAPYAATSNYLSNPSLPPTGDGVPYQTVITSAYCLHNLEGQSYISLSLNQLFDFCKKVWGCGLGVTGNALTMENLGYYFDNSTMLLDLTDNVAEFEVEQMV